jgi:preprotein translocase subunit YajC
VIDQAFAMGPSGGQPASGLGALLPLILIFFVFYFLIIMPNQRKQRQHAEMIAKLKKGDQVVTSGGIHGVVVGTKENVVVIRVDEKTKIEVERSAISTIVSS